jgi:hypothetical protein
MSFDYYKNLGRSLTVTSIIILSSLSAITYHGEAIGGTRGGGAGNSQGGGAGNSQGKGAGNSQGKGAGNSIGMRSDLTKAENASDNARKHAAHNSAVILADPTHYDADGNHIDNGH